MVELRSTGFDTEMAPKVDHRSNGISPNSGESRTSSNVDFGAHITTHGHGHWNAHRVRFDSVLFDVVILLGDDNWMVLIESISTRFVPSALSDTWLDSNVLALTSAKL